MKILLFIQGATKPALEGCWDVLSLDAQWYSAIWVTDTRCALLCATKTGELRAPESSHSRGQCHQTLSNVSGDSVSPNAG